jgi:hypothetical protein
MTSIFAPGRNTSAQSRNTRFHGAQRLGCDLVVVQNTAVIQRDTGHMAEYFPPLVLDGVVAGQHDNANAAARGDALIGFERQVFNQFHAVHPIDISA